MIKKAFSFRSTTNSGNKANIIIMLIQNHDISPSVVIIKRILIKDKKTIEDCLKEGMKLLRKYKEYSYLEEKIGLKLETVFHIIYALILK